MLAALAGRIADDADLIIAAREAAEYLYDPHGLNRQQIVVQLCLLIAAEKFSDAELAKSALERLSELPTSTPGFTIVCTD
jgi:hypothetical protein